MVGFARILCLVGVISSFAWTGILASETCRAAIDWCRSGTICGMRHARRWPALLVATCSQALPRLLSATCPGFGRGRGFIAAPHDYFHSDGNNSKPVRVLSPRSIGASHIRGIIGYGKHRKVVHAVSTCGTTPMVREPW